MAEYRKCCICGCCYSDGWGNVCPSCEKALAANPIEVKSKKKDDKKDNDNGDD